MFNVSWIRFPLFTLPSINAIECIWHVCCLQYRNHFQKDRISVNVTVNKRMSQAWFCTMILRESVVRWGVTNVAAGKSRWAVCSVHTYNASIYGKLINILKFRDWMWHFVVYKAWLIFWNGVFNCADGNCNKHEWLSLIFRRSFLYKYQHELNIRLFISR